MKDLISLIAEIRQGQGGFALFRAPEADRCRFVVQRTSVTTWEESQPQKGFLIAPFAPSSLCPAVVILPEEMGECPLPLGAEEEKVALLWNEEKARSDYRESFQQLYAHLSSGRVKKTVLARRLTVQLSATPSLLSLFDKACRLHPTCFVALWHTPQTGTWLIATPELLVSKREDEGRTMAIAGTMPAETTEACRLEAWSQKNKEEQQQVVDYIHRILQPLTQQLTSSVTYPQRVGTLVHLRTDFQFVTTTAAPTLATALHPTPAVCGTPREEALRVIEEVEPMPRNYYSGFCGMLEVDGSADFYVSLRCMEIKEKEAHLYAGGGILKESEEDDEWQETQRKLRPMLSLFAS